MSGRSLEDQQQVDTNAKNLLKKTARERDILARQELRDGDFVGNSTHSRVVAKEDRPSWVDEVAGMFRGIGIKPRTAEQRAADEVLKAKLPAGDSTEEKKNKTPGAFTTNPDGSSANAGRRWRSAGSRVYGTKKGPMTGEEARHFGKRKRTK